MNKPMSYYSYDLPVVRILWKGIYQREMGIFCSAEAANAFINEHVFECDIDTYSIQTPHGILPSEWWPEPVCSSLMMTDDEWCMNGV